MSVFFRKHNVPFSVCSKGESSNKSCLDKIYSENVQKQEKVFQYVPLTYPCQRFDLRNFFDWLALVYHEIDLILLRWKIFKNFTFFVFATSFMIRSSKFVKFVRPCSKLIEMPNLFKVINKNVSTKSTVSYCP